MDYISSVIHAASRNGDGSVTLYLKPVSGKRVFGQKRLIITNFPNDAPLYGLAGTVISGCKGKILINGNTWAIRRKGNECVLIMKAS